VVEMKRKESELIAERNSPLVQRIKEIKVEHPFWGYRRTWAHLKFVDKLEVNKKRVLRLMQKHSLLVKPNQKLKANRTPTRSKPRPDRPNQWWGIDMTKVMVERIWLDVHRGRSGLVHQENSRLLCRYGMQEQALA